MSSLFILTLVFLLFVDPTLIYICININVGNFIFPIVVVVVVCGFSDIRKGVLVLYCRKVLLDLMLILMHGVLFAVLLLFLLFMWLLLLLLLFFSIYSTFALVLVQ